MKMPFTVEQLGKLDCIFIVARKQFSSLEKVLGRTLLSREICRYITQTNKYLVEQLSAVCYFSSE